MIETDSPYFLAPMAGYTDKPFRYICKKFGAGLTVSELISVNAIYYKNKKTLKLLEKNDIEKPFCIQLFGSDADIFLYAAQSVEDKCDCIDINAGCPVSKVVKTFAGSYLLKDKKRLLAIVDKLKKHIKKPVSVKLRKGFDENSINSMDFYKELENSGVDFITIHPRLRGQFFKGEVDYEHAARVVDTLKIDVVINGGIDSLDKLDKVKEITKAKYFMIGQAAIDKPYIFKEFIEEKEMQKDAKFIKDLAKEHFLLMVAYYGEYLAIRNFRKFFHRYAKGFRFAKQLNKEINECLKKDDVLTIIDKLD